MNPLFWLEPWQWAVVVKPIGLCLMFAPGALIVWYVKQRMPECAVKRLLLVSWKV